MIDIRLPTLEEIARRWTEIEPVLKEATDRTRGCYDPIHVLREIMVGSRGLWLVEDGPKIIAVAVAGPEQYPTGLRLLVVPYVAGERCDEWWAKLIAEFEAAARRMNCRGIQSTGRAGWRRFSEKCGVHLDAIAEVLVREVRPTGSTFF